MTIFNRFMIGKVQKHIPHTVVDKKSDIIYYIYSISYTMSTVRQ